MTQAEIKQKFNELVDSYYEDIKKCSSIQEVYRLNWDSHTKLQNMAYSWFNETWGKGWDAVTDRKDTD